MRRELPPFVLALLFTSFLASCPPLLSAAPAGSSAGHWDAWLEEVEPLVTPRERDAFLTLRAEAEREAFVERFWQVRDPFPQTVRNELEERWESGVEKALSRYGRLDDVRSQVLLLQGEPTTVFEASCAPEEAPVEVWQYDRAQRLRSKLIVLFLKGTSGPVRLWRHAVGGMRDLSVSARERCANGERLANAAMWLRLAGKDYDGMLDRALEPPRPRTDDWVATFRPAEALAPEPPDALADALAVAPGALAADLDVTFTGEAAGRTIVRGRLAVPAGEVECAGATCDFLLSGRVDGAASPPESFRYRLSVPAPAAADDTVEIPFERHLAPGDYRLELRLEERNAGRAFRAARDLAVPRVVLASSEGAAERASVDLVAPGGLLTGPVRFEAVAAGPVAKVAFTLDGKALLTKTRPPFAVQLDLGGVPRPHTIRAEALDAAGRPVASDELAVNAGAQRFAVRLAEPLARTGGGRLEARAEVEAPEGQAVERLELYLGNQPVATLYQPPWSQPLPPLPAREAPGYVRAVAYLADGTSAEDVALLDVPEYGAVVDVRWVELYAAVLDRQGRPVQGLARDDFRVTEDGVAQQVQRFETVGGLPIQVALLMDTSASMRDRLEETRSAARTFLRRAMTPQDRAALIRFDRAPEVAVPLTGDLAALERGLDSLSALDKTALYDSLIFALHYLTGTRGQRAVLLLSDGEDVGSRFGFEQALESAQRAGVAVYAVGLGLPRGGPRKQLARIAAETGGRSFFLDDAAGLPEVYAQIQEDLRSQYLLAYQSTHDGERTGFRRVSLDLAQAGLEARTVNGYYP